MRSPRFVVAFLLLAPVGCSGGASKIVSPLQRGGSIVIEITRSSTPEFNWTSRVTVEAITVSNFSPGGTVDRTLWGYGNLSLTPPVSYGHTFPPPAANLSVGTPPPLQSGVKYRVEVVRSNQASYADWVVP